MISVRFEFQILECVQYLVFSQRKKKTYIFLEIVLKVHSRHSK